MYLSFQQCRGTYQHAQHYRVWKLHGTFAGQLGQLCMRYKDLRRSKIDQHHQLEMLASSFFQAIHWIIVAPHKVQLRLGPTLEQHVYNYSVVLHPTE